MCESLACCECVFWIRFMPKIVRTHAQHAMIHFVCGKRNELKEEEKKNRQLMKCKATHNSIVVRQEEIYAMYNHAHGTIRTCMDLREKPELWKNADAPKRKREIKWNQAAFTVFLFFHFMQRNHKKIHHFKKETRVGKVYQRGIFIAHSTTRSRKEKTFLVRQHWNSFIEKNGILKRQEKRFQKSCSKNRTEWTNKCDTTQQAVNYFRLWIT